MLLKLKLAVDEFNQSISDYNKIVKKNTPLKIDLPEKIKKVIESSIYKDFELRQQLDANTLAKSVSDDEVEQRLVFYERIVDTLSNWDMQTPFSRSERRGMHLLTEFEKVQSKRIILHQAATSYSFDFISTFIQLSKEDFTTLLLPTSLDENGESLNDQISMVEYLCLRL